MDHPLPHRWLARLNPRLMLWGGATLSLSLVIGAALAIFVLWRDLDAEAEADVRRLVRMLAQHAARTVEPVDRAIQEVRMRLEQSGFGRKPLDAQELHELLRTRAAVGAQLLRLVVVDAQGRILARSDQVPGGSEASVDDAWFGEMARSPAPELVFQAPRPSRISGQWVVPLARALTEPGNGRFVGAVIGALDVGELQAFYQSVRLTPQLHLALLRDDGVVLSGVEPQLQWQASIVSWPARSIEVVRRRPAEQGPGLLGLHRVGRWPLIAAAAADDETVMAPWRQRSLAIVSITLPAALGLMLMAWIGALSAQRARGLSRTLGIAEARYESLVESSPDGILLAREGQVQYANRALLDLVGAAELAQIVGRRVDEFLDATGDYHRSPEFDGPPQDAVVRIEHHVRPLQGPPRDVETLITGAPHGGDPTLQVVVRDISARKRLERQLEASRRDVEALALAAETAREREKRRIARELHDELGQVLTVQQLEVEMLAAETTARWPQGGPPIGPQIASRLAAIRSRIEDAIALTRRISGDLRPLVLDDLGLVAALEWLVEQARTRAGIQGRLVVEGDAARLGDEMATALFRIAQESMTNVMRHAGARHVEVRLAVGVEEAQLEVRDDGRGIETGVRRRGLGLRGIEERVRLLGGRARVEALPGGGTCVHVSLPARVAPAAQGPGEAEPADPADPADAADAADAADSAASAAAAQRRHAANSEPATSTLEASR